MIAVSYTAPVVPFRHGEWRPIPGHPNYQINPSGRIRRVNMRRDAKTPPTHPVGTYTRLMVGGRQVDVSVEDLLRVTFGATS